MNNLTYEQLHDMFRRTLINFAVDDGSNKEYSLLGVNRLVEEFDTREEVIERFVILGHQMQLDGEDEIDPEVAGPLMARLFATHNNHFERSMAAFDDDE